MFNFNNILALTLLATIASCIKADELTKVENHEVKANPATTAILTQLKISESNSSNAASSYKCTVGVRNSGKHLACRASDSTSWNTGHNVELKLRCPKSGSGLILRYVEMFIDVTTANVSCVVSNGAVGLGYIELKINAWNTRIFNYSAQFFSD